MTCVGVLFPDVSSIFAEMGLRVEEVPDEMPKGDGIHETDAAADAVMLDGSTSSSSSSSSSSSYSYSITSSSSGRRRGRGARKRKRSADSSSEGSTSSKRSRRGAKRDEEKESKVQNNTFFVWLPFFERVLLRGYIIFVNMCSTCMALSHRGP